MTTYVLSFDLNPDYNQLGFFEEISELGEVTQVLNSVLILQSQHTAKEIRDRLVIHLAPDERMLVLKSSGPAAWRNVICDNKWLIENISSKN